ncbi:MAG: cupin domain-containing protein [Parvibaculaceae bacterium]
MKVAIFTFSDDGDIPNHPHWPMIVYRDAVSEAESDAAAAFEAIFARHGWGDAWRNGIFAFPHYHSNAHEVLGIAEGEALVRLGGGAGRDFTVKKGDAVLLPAGTGHQRLSASADLLVVGAYPPGSDRDLRRLGEADKASIRERVRRVPKPAIDPVGGASGPLISLWKLQCSNV